MSLNLTIVAVASGEPHAPYLKRGFDAFRKSATRYGYTPLILGWGEPWRGLGSKPKLFKQALEQNRIETPYVIFADAYDVWFADDPAIILDRWLSSYHAQGNQITWNAERNCFPRPDWAGKHPRTTSSFKYLNSGLSIGTADAYRVILTQMKVDENPDDHQKPDGKWYHHNDQDDFMAKFLFGQGDPGEPKMNLDSNCILFQTLCGVDESEFNVVTGRNLETDSHPLALHANGPAKTAGLADKILDHAGL